MTALIILSDFHIKFGWQNSSRKTGFKSTPWKKREKLRIPISALLRFSWGSLVLPVLVLFSNDPCWQNCRLSSSPNYLLPFPMSFLYLTSIPFWSYQWCPGGDEEPILPLRGKALNKAPHPHTISNQQSAATYYNRSPQPGSLQTKNASPHCTGDTSLWSIGCKANNESRARDRTRNKEIDRDRGN